MLDVHASCIEHKQHWAIWDHVGTTLDNLSFARTDFFGENQQTVQRGAAAPLGANFNTVWAFKTGTGPAGRWQATPAPQMSLKTNNNCQVTRDAWMHYKRFAKGKLSGSAICGTIRF